MKILQVIPAYLPATRYGGPIFSVHGISAALARRGHTVEVFTTDVDGPGMSRVPRGVAVDVDGVSVWYYPVTRPRRLYRSPAMGRALRARAGEFDIIHLQSLFLWPPVVAAREAHRAGVPYLVSPRGMLVKDLFRRKSRLVKHAWLRLFDQRMIERAAGLHLTSRLEEVEARKFGFTFPPVHMIPNGTDAPSESQLTAGVDPTLLLFLGRVNWKKGLDRLISAMRWIPSARLVIAGNDEEGYRQTLDVLIDRHGLAGRVEFVGPVSGEEKTRLLSRAALLVVPSYSENFGNVVLEAMACGCAVAATSEVGASQILSEASAGVILPGDPEAMGRVIASLLGRPKRLREFGRAGRAAAIAGYTWDAVAARMEAVYAMTTNRER